MTTKQIAEALDKDETTVRRWVKRLAGKKPELAGKVAASSPMVPAEWGLDETVDIIEVGLGRNAALIWRENAVRQNLPQSAGVVTRSDLAEFCHTLVGEMIKQFLPLIQKPAALEIVQDYFTIKGYANKVGVQITYSEAITIGRAAKKLSIDLGKEVHLVDDERWGRVNSYHISVLEEVFRS
jgi:hypothetical protein